MVPAHAGMVPYRAVANGGEAGGPRARGDGPWRYAAPILGLMWSPRTRGWSLGLRQPAMLRPVVPAHAGMAPRIDPL